LFHFCDQSINDYSVNYKTNKKSADKGIAPIPTGHEPVVPLLHQSAYNYN